MQSSAKRQHKYCCVFRQKNPRVQIGLYFGNIFSSGKSKSKAFFFLEMYVNKWSSTQWCFKEPQVI